MSVLKRSIEVRAPKIKYRKELSRPAIKLGAQDQHNGRRSGAKRVYRDRYLDLEQMLKEHAGPPSSRFARVPPKARRQGSWILRKFVQDAERYRTRREGICASVLDQMGPGEFIVIEYSLGSVMAADLLTRLRPDQHIRLLITVGSPLGAGHWGKTWRRLDRFPFDAVDAWVNVHNPWDHVTGDVGLRERNRNVLDAATAPFGNSKPPFTGTHKIKTYMTQPAVAASIAWAMQTPWPPAACEL